nr:AAA family ATPase [Pectobacterium colocasium]
MQTSLQVSTVLPTEIQDGHFTDSDMVYRDLETGDYRLNLLQGLEADERTAIVGKLKRCATLHFHDEATDTLILDYRVNGATRQAFQENFDGSALALFQAFQVLLSLNLYTVSDTLKANLYRSNSHYVSETVPTLASDQRIMRFKNFYFTKQGVEKPMLLKELSDGEHQLLHSLGLCLLFRETNSLFLLDEPENTLQPALACQLHHPPASMPVVYGEGKSGDADHYPYAFPDLRQQARKGTGVCQGPSQRYGQH